MSSLIVSIIAIALTSLLALATMYYGADAFSNALDRADATKLIAQSTQVLGAAELFYVDHDRWPEGVPELLEKEYLRETPTYLAMREQGIKPMVLASWGLGAAHAAEYEGHETPETPSGTPDLKMAPETAWNAPVPLRPTYWVLRSTTKGVCKQVNLASRGDDGIYNGIVPGLVTQCFGLKEPYSVVTTRDASSAYMDMLLEEWNGPEDIAVSKDFSWAIEPTVVKSTTTRPNPEGVGSDSGTSNGSYFNGSLHLTLNGQGTNQLDLGMGSSGNVSAYSSGQGFSYNDVKVTGGFGVTSDCSAGEVPPGEACNLTITPPPAGKLTSCVTVTGKLNLLTSKGTAVADLSAQVCPSVDAPQTSNVAVTGLTHPKDKAHQWWFNDTHVGEYGTKWIRIANTGGAPLRTGTNAIALQAPFSMVGNECPEELWPGSACMMQLNFSPTSSVLYSQNKYPFVLKSDIETVTYYLNGKGLPEKVTGVSVYPNPLVLSPVYEGQVYTGAITVRNYGNTTVYMDKAPVLSDASKQFSLKHTSCSGTGLGGRGACTLSLNFEANKLGQTPADVKFSFDELGARTVDLEAEVLTPFKVNGGKLANAFQGTSFQSKVLAPHAVLLNGKAIDRSLLNLQVSGLPQGLSYNPDTFRIEGTLADTAEAGDYVLGLKGSYNSAQYISEAKLTLPVYEAQPATWHTEATYARVNARIDLPAEDMSSARSNRLYWAYLKSDVLASKGLASGSFKLESSANPALRITGIHFITENGGARGCGAVVSADRLSATGCTVEPPEDVRSVGIHLELATVASPPPIGLLASTLTFVPDAQSAVKAPATPFVFTIDSRYGQTYVMTTGEGSAAAAATSSLNLGSLPTLSGKVATQRIFVRGSTQFGRLAGTFEISGDESFKIRGIGSDYRAVAGNSPAITCAAGSSANFCIAYDHPANGQYSDLYVDVAFTPPPMYVAGEFPHAATLRFVPHESYPLEALAEDTVSLSAKTLAGQTAVLTTGEGKTAAAYAESVDLGAVPTKSGKTVTKRFFIRGSTLNSPLAASFKLEGAANFKIALIGTDYRDLNSTHTYTCTTGYNANPCIARHPANEFYSDIYVDVLYTPEATEVPGAHLHEATLSFATVDGYPLEILGGTSMKISAKTLAGQTAVLTTGEGKTAAAYAESVDLGAVPTKSGKTVTKRFFIRGSTLNSPLAASFKLEGAANFKIALIGTDYRDLNSTHTYTCTTGYNANPCIARHPANEFYSDIYVDVLYTPDATEVPGAHLHEATLSFATVDGYPLEILGGTSMKLSATTTSP